MTPRRAKTRFSDWETVRYELLNQRIRDMALKIEGSRLVPFIEQLYRELTSKGLAFRPPVYLTDSWGCPDREPIIGVPFYLADERLMQIEEEQTGEIEDDRMTMMLLRHEAAHAYNYAYRLWRRPEWAETFGAFTRPYPDTFHPQPATRAFVRHLYIQPYGTTYAQKHPDEDFAESFAVWLTPRAVWRRRYRYWAALEKLRCVDRWMRDLRDKAPLRASAKPYRPVEELRSTLAEHYGERAERYRAAAQGYVDDRLREVALTGLNGTSVALSSMLRKQRRGLVERMVHWSGLDPQDAEEILNKLEERADALNLRLPRRQIKAGLMDLSSMVTALAMDFAYTGQLQR